jgi:nitrate reductase gamma subunit
MRGTRKVKDVFIDHKVPRELRAALPIVTLDGGASSLMLGVPLIYKLHVLLGFTIFLISPFTRMIHIWSGVGALAYLFRPYQIVRTPRTRAREPVRS